MAGALYIDLDDPLYALNNWVVRENCNFSIHFKLLTRWSVYKGIERVFSLLQKPGENCRNVGQGWLVTHGRYRSDDRRGRSQDNRPKEEHFQAIPRGVCCSWKDRTVVRTMSSRLTGTLLSACSSATHPPLLLTTNTHIMTIWFILLFQVPKNTIVYVKRRVIKSLYTSINIIHEYYAL